MQRRSLADAKGGRSGADEIAEVVARWTGIPVSRMLEGEMKSSCNGEPAHQRVIGQEEASAPFGRHRRSRRPGDPKRPIGSFIFLGPTGVGKTELAKALPSSCSTTRGR